MTTKSEQRMQATYLRRTPKSRLLHETARGFMPGGDTRTNTFFLPYPTFIERGEGCRIFDVDGNTYLDLLANYTSLIHGHAHPKIMESVSRQLRFGTAFASPLECQVDLAKAICSRVKSIEQVRFCNSGTEATMNAIRAAKSFTRRNKIVKMEGGYHGTHDASVISVAPPLEHVGPRSAPCSIPDVEGVFRGVVDDVIVAPFNDVDATRQIVERNAEDLAAIIVEPMLGSGNIPATATFLRFLREATRSVGALLIFDEVITFRLSHGGAQELYDVSPDITTLGKLIGGGFPIGAFGGDANVMAVYDPRRVRVFQGGTFNGNAVSMVAGRVALDLLTKEEIARINALGDRLRKGLNNAFTHADVPIQAVGTGSLLQLHVAKDAIRDYRSAAAGLNQFAPLLHMAALNRGLFISTRNSLCASTPMTEVEIDQAIAVFTDVFGELNAAIAAS